MQTALTETERIRYRVEYAEGAVREGELREPTLQLSGEVTLERGDLSGSNYRAAYRLHRAGGVEIRGVRLADRVEVLDPDGGDLRWAWIVTAGAMLQGGATAGFMYPFYDPGSLDGEIEAETVLSEGRGAVLGEPCDWVRASYVDDEEDSRWCIGVDDDLPRALEWLSPEAGSSLRIASLLDPGPNAIGPLDPLPGGARVEVIAGPEAGSAAPAWSLEDANGSMVELRDLRGTVVLLDFWATWCPPCWQEMEALEELLREYEGRPVRAFAVNAMESLPSGTLQRFLADRGVGLELLLRGDALHEFYAPGNLPALAVIDGEGRNIGVTTGYFPGLTEDYVRRLIDRGLGAEAGP